MDRMRRPLLAALVLALGASVAAACGQVGGGGAAGDDTLVIGYVSPTTGPLAPFGEADAFAVDQMRTWFREHPLKVGETTFDVKIIVKDAASSTPDITNGALQIFPVGYRVNIPHGGEQ